NHVHPSYQAWSYAALLQDFNETVATDNIQLKPCAYLHNCTDLTVIRIPFYQQYTVTEVGCIHTCQGLDADYVGVIIGPDLVVRNGEVVTDAFRRSSDETATKGKIKRMKNDPEGTTKLLDRIVKNTYRTLMSRGMKGCYIYCTDPETAAYFKQLVTP
ncbi:DNA/RNA helicase domain-containing protein, partial [Pararcticibacter amylolyticus]